MSKVIRSVKNVTKGYSSVQVKVRDATSNDPWGPTGTQMSDIARLTFNSSNEFYEIVDMLDKRLNDKGKNWRHVLKALKVLDYCLHEGSELVVTWAKQNIYIIKTLREFQYVDEDGRDVGQNVRVAAKELTTLLSDDERLASERSDRRTWKSRVSGLEEYSPSSQRRDGGRRHAGVRPHDDEDTEYRLALEASKYQEEEDRRKRESRVQPDEEDDDLAKAIKLSREEEERRRRELEESNAASLFDDRPTPSTQPQPTGFNQGYQQGSAVDFFANPIDQAPMAAQPTGYMPNAYTGYPNTGAQMDGFGMQPTGFDMFSQQQQQQQAFQPQATGYNPYFQQQQPQPQPQPQPPPMMASSLAPEPTLQPGSNNPWASNSNGMNNAKLQALKPTPTGSNNPFASPFSRPHALKTPSMPSLTSLPEQNPLAAFSNNINTPSTSLTLPQPQPRPQPAPSFAPQKEMTAHEAKLNALLANGDGMDTFGNTGNLRIPIQHTAPGTFVNSAGTGLNKLTAEATGNNPFLRQQFTGMPTVSYSLPQQNGFGSQGTNPFAGAQSHQPQTGQGDLIQL